jgi:hypothetical protein
MTGFDSGAETRTPVICLAALTGGTRQMPGESFPDYLFPNLLPNAARPIRPTPTRRMVVGSGMGSAG